MGIFVMYLADFVKFTLVINNQSANCVTHKTTTCFLDEKEYTIYCFYAWILVDFCVGFTG